MCNKVNYYFSRVLTDSNNVLYSSYFFISYLSLLLTDSSMIEGNPYAGISTRSCNEQFIFYNSFKISFIEQ